MLFVFTIVLCLLSSTTHGLVVDHKREYQMQLFESLFTSRSVGITSWLTYLKSFEGNTAFSFTINTASGYSEIVHEKRYDTIDNELDALHVDLKVQNTQTGPDAGTWVSKLKYKGTDPIVTRSMPLDVSSSASNPSRKLEFDYHRYDIGNSQQSKVTVPSNWAPNTAGDVNTYFKDFTTLKGISSGEHLYIPSISKGDFYTYSLSEIALTFNGLAFKGYLVILYDDVNGAYFESTAPFRAEFSWRYEAPAGASGTQMGYDPVVSKKMMDFLLAISSSTYWFNDSPSALGDYVY